MTEIILAISKLIALSIATEAFTEIATSSKIIAPLKNKLKLWTYPPDQPPPEYPTVSHRIKVFIDALWSCGYCSSVWVAGAFAFFGPYPNSASTLRLVAYWVINWMIIHRLSNWAHVAFEFVKNGRIRTYDIVLKINENPQDDEVIGEQNE